jgi:hypothetical protein
MKPNRVLTLIPQLAATLATAGFLTVSAHAQGFDAGSNGSLGDVVITNDVQIPLPPDGKLHFKSLTVVSNAYVSFTRNANNTPVYILSGRRAAQRAPRRQRRQPLHRRAWARRQWRF